jgi:Protein of unknown function, DUF481
VPSRHIRSLSLCCFAALAGATPPALAQTAGAPPPQPPTAAPAPDSAPAPAQARAPAPRPPRSPWRLGTEIAFTDISGNRQLQLFQSTLTVVRQTPERFNLDFKLEGRYGESNHQEAAKSAAARIRFDWTPRAFVSPFLGLDAEYDHIRKIDARLSGGAGINLNVSYREPTRVTVALGVLEEYVRYASPTSPGSVSDTRLQLRLALVHTLRTGVQAEFNLRYQPSTARMWDYIFKTDGALRVALTTKLGWRTTYAWYRDSTPAPGVGMDDRTLTTGLLIQWW